MWINTYHWYVYSLKALDLVTMKKLDSKVNIIPIIAKADTITKAELQKFKAKVSFLRVDGLWIKMACIKLSMSTCLLLLSFHWSNFYRFLIQTKTGFQTNGLYPLVLYGSFIRHFINTLSKCVWSKIMADMLS